MALYNVEFKCESGHSWGEGADHCVNASLDYPCVETNRPSDAGPSLKQIARDAGWKRIGGLWLCKGCQDKRKQDRRAARRLAAKGE